MCSTAAILVLHILETLRNVTSEGSTNGVELSGHNVASLDVYIPPSREDDTFVVVSMIPILDMLF
jgi:hypothetical protein